MQSTIMKLYHLIFELLIIISVSDQNLVKCQHRPAPNELSLRIQTEQGNIFTINLKRVETFLANEHLPVKITLDDKAEQFGDVDGNIMLDVGKFYMYHDYCSKSAFVYFQERGILNGVIDVTYSVTGLPIHESHNVLKVRSKYLRFLGFKRYIKKTRPLRSSDNDTAIIQTRQIRDVADKPVVYPEILVAVGYNMHNALGNDFVKTISHVLTVYNAVDMLYKLVESVSINLNIATIVIETIQYSWYFIPKKFSNTGVEGVDRALVNTAISAYFSIQEKQFPRYSYDFVAFNTRLPLVAPDGTTTGLGYSIFAPRSFIFPPGKSKYHRYNLAALDFKLYESYTTIAHELAHVFTAKHDGVGSLLYNTVTCGIQSLMAGHGCTKSCLQWSRKTEREFTAFFRSPARCILINEPRSLLPPRPRKIFTGIEQCRCYGFQSFDPPDIDGASWWCNEPMDCFDEQRNLKPAPTPLDGTPCGQDRVCWDQKCESTIQTHL